MIVCFASLCFQRFLQRFIDPTSTEDENAGLDLNEPLYMQKLEEVMYFIYMFISLWLSLSVTVFKLI